jgi:hypothetical protein
VSERQTVRGAVQYSSAWSATQGDAHTHSLTRTLTHSQDPDESQCITEARELVRVVQRDGRADDHHAVEVLQRLQRLRGDHGLHGTETETGTCKSSE